MIFYLDLGCIARYCFGLKFAVVSLVERGGAKNSTSCTYQYHHLASQLVLDAGHF